MRTDHWRNDFFYSIKNKVHPKKLVSPDAVLIRFLILTISMFLFFSITADDQSQISYASENLTGTNSSNVSSELIDPSGTVTSWAGYPVSGLTVSAWQGSNLISQTVTDGNGAYNLDLAPGTYDLTAGGTATGGEEQKEYLPQTQQVYVQEPVTVNFQDMLLKNSVYGVITDENGNPLQYTMAEVYDDEGNCIDDNDAGADGHYKLDLSYYFSQQDLSVTSGNFWVVFYGDYLLEQEFNVQVNRDEAYRLDAVMQNATILQGTVTGQSTAIDDGTYATSEVIMYFTDPNGNEGTDYCSIGHTKNYYFEVDPSLVTVHHIGMTVYGYHDYYQPISLTSGQVNIHNITLVEKGIITVNVTNSTNQPLNGASVSVQSESFDYLLYTDTDGMLSFAVEDDDWTVCASHDDYNKVVEYLNVSGGGTYQINITLVKEDLPVTLEGYVTDSVTGTPISNCYVRMEFSNGEYQYVDTMTDTDGYYVFDSSSFGEIFYSGLNVNLNAEKQDYNTYSTNFILPDGLFIHNISLVHDTILWGSVTDPDGNVVYTDVTLSYTHEGETIEESVDVDEGGYYRFEGINSADDSQYHLSAQYPFYLPYQTTLNVLPNQSTQHDIIMNYYSGAVTVNILNTQGQGLNGVTVSIGNESFAIVKTTDATGSTTFQHIPDGNWTIEANYAGYTPATAPVSISGGSSEQVTLTLIQQGLPVTMEGYVTDAVDGTPLPNTYIYFWPSSHPTQTNIYTKTDSNGYYKFSSAQFSEFVSGLSGVLDVRPFQHEKPRIFMTIGEGPLIQYDLQLNPYTGSITVHLIDSTNNQPVPGLTVYLWGDEDQETTSDANGIVTFEKVGPSEWWEVAIWDSNNDYYIWDGYYYPLQEGEHLDINVFLVPTTVSAIIEGTVVDDTNNVVPGARAELSFINGNWIYTWALKTTDVYGKFLMDLDNTANLMRVTISKTGYQTVVYDFNPTDLPINQIFVLQPDFSLTTLVDGYVQDFFENPLSGITVDFYRGGTLYQTTSTNPAGYYSINLPVGIYNMIVHQTGFVTQNQGFTIFYGSGYQFSYTLFNDCSSYGQVTGDTIDIYEYNIPISGANIKIYQNGNIIDSTTSNDEGYYQTNSVPQGDYTIHVQAPNYDTLIQSITFTEGYANHQDFLLEPSTSCAIHGYVTDENTGLPISNVNIVLFKIGEEEPVSDTITDSTGFYSFTNLSPGYYNLEYSATGYVTSWGVDDGFLELDMGQDAELNKPLKPLVPSTIEGTVTSWAGPVAGAAVTLDNTNTVLTGSDGKFIFPVITAWHEILVNKNGVDGSWSGWIDNNEYKTISIYLNAKVLETDPIKDSTVQNLDQIKVRVFEARPDLNTASLSVSSSNGAVSGSITRENDWIIFTPNGGSFTTQGRYTVTATIPSELSNTFEFYYYPITNTPPVVQIVSPAPDSFFRDPTSISITATIQNDVGNGISTDSKIYFDGVALATTLSGRQMTAIANNLGHGWHTIRAVAIDNQGLSGETSWNILLSTIPPQIFNVEVTNLFSPYHGNMHVQADVTEPIVNVYITFDNYPGYTLSLGSFTDKIDGYWDGWIRRPFGSTFIPPDGPVKFTIHGRTADFHSFTIASGTTQIDSSAPVFNINPQEYFNSHELDIIGSIIDYSEISTFDATTSGGTIDKSFYNFFFDVKLNVVNDGKYTVTLTATDAVGNTASTSRTVWSDTVDPILSFNLPDEGDLVRPGQLVSFRVGDSFSGLNRDYVMRWSTKIADLIPKYMEVSLDGRNINDKLTYGSRSYTNVISGNTPSGYEYLASLGGVTITYDPKTDGFLTDGLHQFQVIIHDMAGNEVTSTLEFSSITQNPDITEKDMRMTGADDNETLYLSFDVQENSDGGFGIFTLDIDGSIVNESPTLVLDPLIPYNGTLSYQLTREFQEGPHTVNLKVVDGRGFENTLQTGFYHMEKVTVPLEDFTGSSEYWPDFTEYSGTHNHQTSLVPSTYFIAGNQALYGYCDMDGPSRTLLYTYSTRSSNWILPMGGQLAQTFAQTPFVDSKDADYLSIWMSDISVQHLVRWGWGGTILAYFDDGSGLSPSEPQTGGAIKDFDKLYSMKPPVILYARHEAPWGNWAGIVDNSVGSKIGDDGKIWKHYIIKIPDYLDKSHLSVVFVWETVNWFQNSANEPLVSVSSKIDNVEFIKSPVITTNPLDGAEDMPIKPTISALFRLPMDPTSFTSDKFYIANLAGTPLAGSASYNSGTNWGSFTSANELGGLTSFMGYVSPEMRTIYGKILPTPEPYTWTFTTRRGEAKMWQNIIYNGEEYQVFLVWGSGYSGGTPGYLSPSSLASTYGAPLIEIQIVKYVNGKYYEVGDMTTKKIILQAAQRKAFYESFTNNYNELIDQSLKDWVDDKADTWSGEVLYFLSGIFGDPAEVPNADDIIKDLIASTLGDGSSPFGLSGVEQALSWYSAGITGATKVNDLVNKLLEMKAEKAGLPFEESVVGDVLGVAEIVGNEVAFQKELWDFVFKTMWQIEITNQFRSQLATILPYTSGDTHDAVSQMLSADTNSLKRDIGNKIKEHIADQTVSIIKDAVFEAISENPYGKIVLTTFKVFFALASFTSWDDVHADTHIALDYIDAEESFYNAWSSIVSSTKSRPANQITPYDVSLPATAAKLWYSSGGNFYTIMSAIGDIVEHWPTSGSGWSTTIAGYQNAANNYLSRSKILIPELIGSDSDINALLPLIKAGTERKASNIYIGAFSPIVLLVTAEDGRRIGYDPSLPENQRIVNDFGSDAFYNSPYSEPQAIIIPAFVGKLTIQAFGVDNDNYRIEVQTLDADNEAISGSSWTGSVSQGVYKYFTVLLDDIGSVNPYDETLPLISITGITSGGTYNNGVIPQISVTDPNLEGWTATLNGQPYSGEAITTNGLYFLLVRATDGVNVVFQVMNFVINMPSTIIASSPLMSTTGILFISQTIPTIPSITNTIMPSLAAQTVTNTNIVNGGNINENSQFNWILAMIVVLILLVGSYGIFKKVKN